MAWDFDGAVGRVDLDSLADSESWSCFFAMYCDGYGDSSYPYILLSPGTGDLYIMLMDVNVDYTGRVRVLVPWSSSDGDWFTPNNSFSTGEWVRVFISYDGSSVDNDPTIILNGTTQSLTENDTPDGTRESFAAEAFIGNNNAKNRSMDGKLAEFAWWNAVVPKNIGKAMTNGYAPTIYPANMSHYIPFIRTLQDLAGSATLTDQGGTTVAPHPSVIYPHPVIIGVPSAIAGNQYDETITENLAMQDSISSKGNVYGFTIVESLASGDSLGPASVDHNISLEEIVSMLDVLTVTADHNVSLEDAMTLTDELKTQLESGLTLEEAIAIVDDIETSADLNINITEHLSLTDAVKTIIDIWLNISEIIALTDIISIPLPGEGDVWDETITENLAMQDTFTTSLVSYLKLEDNAALADIITTTATMYVAIKESFALIDTIEFEGIGQAINWTLTENMAVQDQIASIVTIALSLSEDIALQDIIGDTVIFNIKLTENISLNEVLSTVLEYGLKITENLAMGEVFVLTRIRPSIVIRRGKTFVFTIDTVSPHAGVAPKKGKADIKKWH